MGERKPNQIELYNDKCNENLKHIDFPDVFRDCCGHMCSNRSHHSSIDKLYSDIVCALSDAATFSYEGKLFSKKKL